MNIFNSLREHLNALLAAAFFTMLLTAGTAVQASNGQPSARAGGVTCQIGSKSTVANVIRISDSNPLGSPGPRNECFDAVSAAREGITCVHVKKSRYGIVRVSDGFPIHVHGTMTIDECTASSSTAADGLVCSKADRKKPSSFVKVRIADRRVLTSGLTLAECTSF